MRVLVLNAGSSSLKASVVVDGGASARAQADWRVTPDGSADRAVTLASVVRELGALGDLGAIAHRVVHGGERFVEPAVLDDDVLAELEALAELAPLHNVPATETIRAARAAFPATPHVACFDTAFHATLPEPQVRYPLPAAWRTDWGIRRFGFHGLSVEWAVSQAARLLDRPSADLGLVVAHLGSGCSVSAVEGGRSAWTSMGFTPLEGLMMATRSGSIDPGILLHLLRNRALDLDELADALEHRSGLAGVSGVGGDLREVLAAATRGEEDAALAVDMFVARAAAGIAAAATALRRWDALVFTGGIGEHAAGTRREIVSRLATLGVPPIGADEVGRDRALAAGPPAVIRLEAREDLVAAGQAERTLLR
jgi:acetate kinase